MIRVRFAPSPTGHLHVGGARTALFNWLYARHHGGRFILRIEDTDRSRSTEENIGFIEDALTWLGLDWDEGPPTPGYRQLDDWILVRTDGTPTYNFCVVVDDVTMEITHVIRGNDHLSNTPKQILCYEALGYPVPEMAHVSMILGPDRHRLSKRHGATSVQAFRDAGLLPEAMVNYMARLGWSHGDQEIFSREEVIRLFDIKDVASSGAVFDHAKLEWLSHQCIKRMAAEELAAS